MTDFPVAPFLTCSMLCDFRSKISGRSIEFSLCVCQNIYLIDNNNAASASGFSVCLTFDTMFDGRAGDEFKDSAEPLMQVSGCIESLALEFGPKNMVR